MESILGKFSDGGILITYPIFILFLVIIGLFIRGLIKKESRPKMKELIINIGWFVIAWAYLGRTIGLIRAFDNVSMAGEVAPSLLSGGLKMALVGPFMGLFTFAVARIFVIVFVLRTKKNQ